MTTFMNYLVEANVSLLVLLISYKLLFHQETNFSFQRYFLLSGILFSLLIPLFHFSYGQSTSLPSLSSVLPSVFLPEVEYSATRGSSPISNMVWWIYLTGVVIFSAVFLIRIFKLIKLIQSATLVTVDNFKIIESGNYTGTFSFFHYIFIGGSEHISPSERKQIVEHEQVHAKKMHSVDILLLNLLSISFWFNPFILIYKNVFIQLHEFEADARAVKNHDVNTYCNLLARVALQSFGFSLASHFNNSLTVKRITMIKSIKRKISTWKLFLAASLFLCMFYLFACNEQGAEKSPVAARTQPQSNKSAKVSSNDQVYLVVEEPPTYPGGFDEMNDYLQENIKYPKAAADQELEGTVFVSFIVEKDGTISEASVMKGFHVECDLEALKVVESFAPWNPGKQSGDAVRVKFVLPIKFKLED